MVCHVSISLSAISVPNGFETNRAGTDESPDRRGHCRRSETRAPLAVAAVGRTMDEGIPEGWTRWSDEPDRTVFVYRPDVFDSQAFPAACIPTIYLSDGPHRNRRPERRRTGFRSREWYVTLYLEPEVVLAEERYDERSGPRRERYAGPTVRGGRARLPVGVPGPPRGVSRPSRRADRARRLTAAYAYCR